MAPKQLNFITGNKNKLTEVKAILADVVDLQSQSLDLIEIQGTIEEISTDKCRRAAEIVSYFQVNKIALTDIIGQRPSFGRRHLLVFQCTERAPWTIYVCPHLVFSPRWTMLTKQSKWFLEAIGHTGLNNLLVAYPDKSAQAVCTFAYCEGPGHEPIVFQGRTDVSIPGCSNL